MSLFVFQVSGNLKSGQQLYQCVVSLSMFLTPFIPQICCHLISNLQSGNGQRHLMSLLPEAQAVPQLTQRTASHREDLRSSACHLRHSPPCPIGHHPSGLSAAKMQVAHWQSYSGLALYPNACQGDLGRRRLIWECHIEGLVKNFTWSHIILVAFQKTAYLAQNGYHFKCFRYTKRNF